MSTLRRRLVAMLLVLLVLSTISPITAMAEVTSPPLTESEAIELLQRYNIVRGDPSGGLDLDQPITRAQAATVFVRVLGYEELSKSLRDAVPFTDAVGHWAAGEVTMVERLGLMRGDGNRSFRPQAQITYAEVLMVLLRLVKQEPTGPWNPDAVLSAANRLGFAPRGTTATAPALRGKIFWSLAAAITQVPLPSGETIMQAYLDHAAPSLSLDQTKVETDQETITITGTAQDARQVLVSGERANLSPSTGRFTYNAPLSVGGNSFTVEAIDIAGNKTAAVFTADRRAPIVSIEIEGPAMIRAGSTNKLTIKAKNSTGTYVPLTGIDVSLSGDVATFDLSNTTLKAGERPGRGVLTLRSGSVRQNYTFDVTTQSSRAKRLAFAAVNSGVAPAVDKEYPVQVQVVDENGRVVPDDYFRNVRLSVEGSNSVVLSSTVAETKGGLATFTVRGTEVGKASLVANSVGLEEATLSMEFVTSTRIVLAADPSPVRPDGATGARITAVLQDENGRVVSNNTSGDLNIALQVSGTDGYLVDPYLSIRKGQSSSTDQAQFKAGFLAGTATFNGSVTSGANYRVQSLALPVMGTPEPVKLQVVTPTNNRVPPGSAPIDVTIQVVDSRNRVVTWGSFGFRLRVATSNSDPVVNGMPEGLSLTFPGLDYGPAYDTRQERAVTVAGRTHQGVATVKLAYSKSGTVTITPELLPQVDEAYHPTIGLGQASSSRNLESVGTQYVFAGTATGLTLTADSALGKDKPGAAVAPGAGMVVRARVVDAGGAPIPDYNGNVTLTRQSAGDKVTRLVGTTGETITRPASNGVVEFSLQATSTAGFDQYTATAGSLPSGTVTVAVRKEKPVPPQVVAIRGVAEDAASPVVGYIAPDDAYMDIQLAVQTSPYPNEPSYWVTAQVIRKGESSPVVTDAAVNLAANLPLIRIPKHKLRAGNAIYQVIINDGFGNSDPSPDLGRSEALNAVYATSYRLTEAYYDATSTKLLLVTSGLPSDGLVAREQLAIVKDGSHKISLNDNRVTVVSSGSNGVLLQLNGLGTTLDPAVYSGSVALQADDGWYTSRDGSLVAKANGAAVFRPSAVITHGTLDRSTHTLYLYGYGLTQGPAALGQIRVGTVALRTGTGTAYDRITAVTDTRITVSLSQATFDGIEALSAPDVAITANTGWLRVTYGSMTFDAKQLEGASRLLGFAVTITSASYNRETNTLTLFGKGFTGATLDWTKLSFRRTSSSTERQLTDLTVSTVEDDISISVRLNDADAAFFEATANGGFSGQQVFINGSLGWLKDAQQRQASPIPTDLILFTVPTR